MATKSFTRIFHSLEELKSILTSQNDEYLNAVETSKYLKIKIGTLYNLVNKNKITHHKPNGGKLLFKKSDLNKWIENHRIYTVEEYEEKLKKNNSLLDK